MIDFSTIGIDLTKHNKCFELEKNSTNNSTNKINLDGLELEITRKCNYKCKHCGRGEAQNKTISKEIVDMLFCNINNSIKQILLGGGEPLLAIDMIEYFCNKLIEKNINVSFIKIFTNGNVSNEANSRLLNIFQTLIKNKKDIVCIISVSDDDYHAEQDKTGEYLKSYKYFLNYASDNLQVILNNPVVDNLYEIANAGRAKELIKNINNLENESLRPIFKADAHMFTYGHRVPIINNTIPCTISLSVNGDVKLYQIFEYKEADKNSMGNILNKDILSIIHSFNQNAIVECYEEKTYIQMCNMLSNFHLFSDSFQKSAGKELKIYKYCYQRIFEARKIFLELFPNIPVKVIREHFVIPSYEEWLKMIYSIYKEIYKGKVILGDLINGNFADICLSILEDEKTNLGEKYNLFSANKDYVKEYLIYHFGDLLIK